MRVLVAGCGYVGTRLATTLVEGGHEVWGLRRDPGDLPHGLRPVAADLLMSEAPAWGEGWLHTIDRVVFCAAPDASTPEGYRETYVEGVRNTLGWLAVAEAPVERFLFVSSTAVWGDAGGGWVDETTPPSPDDFRGATLLDAEGAVRSGPFPGVVLRLGGIYGPGRTRLLDRVRSGEARCAEGGPLWSNRVHRDDAAGMLVHLLALDWPASVYIGVDDEPAPLCDVYRFVAELLRVPAPGTGAEATGERSNKRCSNRRLKESGYRFRFPSYREGYREITRTRGSNTRS